MIDNYADATVEQTLEAISSFSDERLVEFRAFERDHKDRTGVTDGIDDLLVTIEVPNGGYFYGYWFDEGGRYERLDTPKLRRAARETLLKIVEA
jgi:hypothetical protein